MVDQTLTGVQSRWRDYPRYRRAQPNSLPQRKPNGTSPRVRECSFT